jgi:hypothetical protein
MYFSRLAKISPVTGHTKFVGGLSDQSASANQNNNFTILTGYTTPS